MRQTLTLGLTVLMFTTISTVASAKDKNPPAPPDPKFSVIQNISVLPIVDARVGQKAGVNLEKLQREVVKLLVKGKHYAANAASSPGEAGHIEVENMEDVVPSYIKKLGPSTERWVMVIFLNDITSKARYSSTGNAELGGYLFDKDHGERVWKNRSAGQFAMPGDFGISKVLGGAKGAALSDALNGLFATLPNLPKSHK